MSASIASPQLHVRYLQEYQFSDHRVIICKEKWDEVYINENCDTGKPTEVSSLFCILGKEVVVVVVVVMVVVVAVVVLMMIVVVVAVVVVLVVVVLVVMVVVVVVMEVVVVVVMVVVKVVVVEVVVMVLVVVVVVVVVVLVVVVVVVLVVVVVVMVVVVLVIVAVLMVVVVVVVMVVVVVVVAVLRVVVKVNGRRLIVLILLTVHNYNRCTVITATTWAFVGMYDVKRKVLALAKSPLRPALPQEWKHWTISWSRRWHRDIIIHRKRRGGGGGGSADFWWCWCLTSWTVEKKKKKKKRGGGGGIDRSLVLNTQPIMTVVRNKEREINVGSTEIWTVDRWHESMVSAALTLISPSRYFIERLVRFSNDDF